MDRLLPSMPKGRNRARFALLLLLLAAFGAQQWAVQSHWHARVAATASTAAGQDGGAPVHHQDCLWCQVASHAGTAAAPPAPFTLFLAAAGTTALPAAGHESVLIAPLAHAWLSRGPPAA